MQNPHELGTFDCWFWDVRTILKSRSIATLRMYDLSDWITEFWNGLDPEEAIQKLVRA